MAWEFAISQPPDGSVFSYLEEWVLPQFFNWPYLESFKLNIYLGYVFLPMLASVVNIPLACQDRPKGFSHSYALIVRLVR